MIRKTKKSASTDKDHYHKMQKTPLKAGFFMGAEIIGQGDIRSRLPNSVHARPVYILRFVRSGAQVRQFDVDFTKLFTRFVIIQ
jgi:hypothetical protein